MSQYVHTVYTGQVLDQDGAPLVGQAITLAGTDDFEGQDYRAATNTLGRWTVTVPADWTGVITCESNANYEFDPGSYVVTDVSSTRDYPFTGTVTTSFIKLVRSASGGIPGVTQAYRLIVTVTDSEGLEPEIFLYARRTTEPVGGEQADQFLAVCSPSDIATYPVGGPDPGLDLPYYRLSQIDLEFRNPQTADETWQAIVQDVRGLCEAHKFANDLLVEEIQIVTF